MSSPLDSTPSTTIPEPELSLNTALPQAAPPTLVSPPNVNISHADFIATFRPTPREVISGIAPHIFDDRRRRRRASQRAASPRPRHWYDSHKGPESSPLRLSAAIAWDEHSVFVGELTLLSLAIPFERLRRIWFEVWALSVCVLRPRTS